MAKIQGLGLFKLILVILLFFSIIIKFVSCNSLLEETGIEKHAPVMMNDILQIPSIGTKLILNKTYLYSICFFSKRKFLKEEITCVLEYKNIYKDKKIYPFVTIEFLTSDSKQRGKIIDISFDNPVLPGKSRKFIKKLDFPLTESIKIKVE